MITPDSSFAPTRPSRNARPVHSIGPFAQIALTWAVNCWFAVTVIGQLIFVVYVVAVYGGAVLRGDLKGWNAVMPHGYVPGETMGNLSIGMHLLLAAIIMVGGALQLVPNIRSRAPRFHHWNGRMYLTGAVFAAASGLYMMWTRGTVGNVVQHAGTSLNALLIFAFAYLALVRAIGRDIAAHRRWALRLFLCVGGVWFFRVGLMFWIAVNGGPAGFDPKTFTGPFLSFLAFAQYLLPLAVLELYLACRRGGGTTEHIGMAGIMIVATAITVIGVAVATMGMWLPNM